MLWYFGPFCLDPEARELRRDGVPVKIEPRPFDVLEVLIENRSRIVSQEDLRRLLWPDSVVSDAALASAVRDARKAIRSDGSSIVIRNFYGRGFRFVGHVEAADPRDLRVPGEQAAPAEAGGTASPQHPTAAVAHPTVRKIVPALPAGLVPFVGRATEMAALRHGLEEAASGRARVLFLAGEAGIGKTRLTQELTRLADERDATVLVGRCDEESPPPFWVWTQVVRGFVAAADAGEVRDVLGISAPELVRILPTLREIFPDLEVGERGDPEQSRLRLFDAFTGFLRASTHGRPMVVVLDDLHWSDPSSLLLLRVVATELVDVPLLILGTYRPTDIDAEHPLTRLQAVLEREANCDVVPVKPLDSQQSRDLLAGALQRGASGLEAGARRAPAEPAAGDGVRGTTESAEAGSVLDMACRTAEGNPFFLLELFRHLQGSGKPAGGGGRVGALVDVQAPTSVRDLLSRRLKPL